MGGEGEYNINLDRLELQNIYDELDDLKDEELGFLDEEDIDFLK